MIFVFFIGFHVIGGVLCTIGARGMRFACALARARNHLPERGASAARRSVANVRKASHVRNSEQGFAAGGASVPRSSVARSSVIVPAAGRLLRADGRCTSFIFALRLVREPARWPPGV